MNIVITAILTSAIFLTSCKKSESIKEVSNVTDISTTSQSIESELKVENTSKYFVHESEEIVAELNEELLIIPESINGISATAKAKIIAIEDSNESEVVYSYTSSLYFYQERKTVPENKIGKGITKSQMYSLRKDICLVTTRMNVCNGDLYKKDNEELQVEGIQILPKNTLLNKQRNVRVIFRSKNKSQAIVFDLEKYLQIVESISN